MTTDVLSSSESLQQRLQTCSALYLEYSELADYSWLANCTNLKRLSLPEASPERLSFLNKLESLEWLNLTVRGSNTAVVLFVAY